MAVETQFKVTNQSILTSILTTSGGSGPTGHHQRRKIIKIRGFLPAHVGFGTGYSEKRSRGSLKRRIVGEINGGVVEAADVGRIMVERPFL
eukprot:scaffold82056_cov35-Cyclotella_meneghiniana.AAC.1